MDPETEQTPKPPNDLFINSTDYPKVDALIERIFELLNLNSYDLSWQFASAVEIKELNRQFRNKNTETDVLSFPQIEWEKPISVGAPLPRNNAPQIDTLLPLGDLIVCLEVAALNAQKIGQSFEREICFLFLHGILHLCGHDHIDIDDEERMLAEQRKVMDILDGSKTDTPLWQGCLDGVLN